jgi:hypothetical protein
MLGKARGSVTEAWRLTLKQPAANDVPGRGEADSSSSEALSAFHMGSADWFYHLITHWYSKRTKRLLEGFTEQRDKLGYETRLFHNF